MAIVVSLFEIFLRVSYTFTQVSNYKTLLLRLQIVMGAARLGFVATFMSDPMISGFTTGSAVLVVISQMPHILGIKVPQFSRPLAAPKVTVFTKRFLWKGPR